MTERDITDGNLEAAIMDQKVAGAFAGKRYAFLTYELAKGFGLGVAVHNEAGFYAIAGKEFPSREAADAWADGLNRHIGLTHTEQQEIILSSMRRG